jgi:hypothetical protein
MSVVTQHRYAQRWQRSDAVVDEEQDLTFEQIRRLLYRRDSRSPRIARRWRGPWV